MIQFVLGNCTYFINNLLIIHDFQLLFEHLNSNIDQEYRLIYYIKSILVTND
jgi:hypothetical protein